MFEAGKTLYRRGGGGGGGPGGQRACSGLRHLTSRDQPCLPAAPCLPRRYEQTWPVRVRLNPAYVAVKVAFNALVLNYAASSFIVLWLSDSLAVWRSVGYAGHIALLAIIGAGAVFPPRKAAVRPEAAKQGGAAHAAAAAPAAHAKAAATGDGKKEL